MRKGNLFQTIQGNFFLKIREKKTKSSLNFAQTVVRKPEFDETRKISIYETNDWENMEIDACRVLFYLFV